MHAAHLSIPAAPASPLLGVPPPSLGIPALDAHAPFQPGRLTLLVAPMPVLEDLEARLLLDAVAHGGEALLACGDNRLDAYALLRRARTRGLGDALADGTWLSRAFTVHQLVTLLEDTLPRLARERPARVALVTGLLGTFLDEDVEPDEARTLLRRSLRHLAAWAAESRLPVAATLETPVGPAARALAGIARTESPFLLEVLSHPLGWKACLRPGTDVLLPLAPGARQTRLDAHVPAGCA